jgi:hypothetical protein
VAAGVLTLLLTTTGRRSGQPFTTPLIYVEDGGDYVVLAYAAGKMSQHKIRVLEGDFSEANGYLTPSLKVRRDAVVDEPSSTHPAQLDHLVEVAHVRQEDRDLRDVAEARSARFESAPQVGECLLALRPKAALDDLAIIAVAWPEM